MSESTPEKQPSIAHDVSPHGLPETLDELLALGQQRLDEQQYGEAQQAFAQALALEPANVQARHNLGYALQCQGAVAEAMAAYEIVLRSATPLAQSAFNLGELLADTGRDVEAEQAFTHASGLDPGLVLAHVNLGALQVRAGHLDEGRRCYERALEVDPSCHIARLKLANVMVRAGQWEEALHEYRQLEEAAWNLGQVHYRRGVALAARGDEKGAMEALELAVAADPSHVRTHLRLALLYAQQGQYDKATPHFQKAAELRPDDAQVQYNLGNMHARQAIEAGELVNYGYADAALRAYRRAIELDPQRVKAYYNLACVAEKMSTQEGIEAWEQYLHVAGNVPTEAEWVVKARGYLRHLKGA
jgi:protein O-GlcNAc transferase